MSFKRKLLLSCVCLCLSSCSWWGEQTQNKDRVEIARDKVLKGNDVSCIDGIGGFFSDFFKGYSSPKEVSAMKSCIVDTMDNVFKFLSENDKSKGLNRVKIKNILKSVDSKRTEESLVKASDLLFLSKRIFVGGEKDLITHQEWQKVSQALDDVSGIFAQAAEPIRVVFYENQDSLAYREASYKKLRALFSRLDALRVYNKAELSEPELIKFLSYVLSGENLGKFYKVALKAKPFLFGDQAQSYKKMEKDIFKRVWAVFEIQARLRALNFSSGFMIGTSVVDAVKAMTLLTQSFYEWSKADKLYSFSIKRVSEILEELYSIGFLKDQLSDIKPVNQTIDKLLFVLFKKNNLDVSSFQTLNEYIKNWAYGQFLIVNKFSFDWAKDFKTYFDHKKYKSKVSEEMVSSIEGMKKPRFITNESGAISIFYPNKELYESEKYFDVSLKYSLFSFALPIMKAYSAKSYETNDVQGVNITKADLEQIFLDFRPLGLEFGFSNPFNCGITERVFTEANSLTFTGNGDNQVSAHEATEWLGTMLVVSSISDHVFERLDHSCTYQGQKVFGHPYYDRECFKKDLFFRGSNYLDFFPGMEAYMNILSSESQKLYFSEQLSDTYGWVKSFDEIDLEKVKDHLLNTLNSCKAYENFPISRSEFNSTVAVSIYVENIFSMYDTTGLNTGLSGWFSNNEKSGSDLILDGKELSQFFKEKFENERRLIETKIKENAVAGLHNLINAFDLSEGFIKLDRAKALGFLNDILGEVKTAPHIYQKNYCRDVHASAQKGAISYKTDDIIQCKSKYPKKEKPTSKEVSLEE